MSDVCRRRDLSETWVDEEKKGKNRKTETRRLSAKVRLIIVNGLLLFCDFQNAAAAKSVILILCHSASTLR